MIPCLDSKRCPRELLQKIARCVTGWWSRMDAPQLLPYLTRLALALLREEPDSRSLPTQGKATSTPLVYPEERSLI